MLKRDDFDQLFSELGIPVVICRNEPSLPVCYMNMQATLMFFPTQSVGQLQGNQISLGIFADHLRFPTFEERAAMEQRLTAGGAVEGAHCGALIFDGTPVEVSLWGNLVRTEGGVYAIFYLARRDASDAVMEELDNRLSAIINSTIPQQDVESSIQTVLAMAGAAMKVSRAHIFEETSPTMTRNTYEWCAEGVEPAIQDLQSLKKEDYSYDVIVASGMYITSDVRKLPDEDRVVLEMQGIKSLAILTIYNHGAPLGYVGFDDTEVYREWGHREIQFLKDISGFLATLITRRNSENQAQRSQKMLQLVSDSVEDIIYANTLDNYELLFTSTAMQKSLGKTNEEMIGKKCYEVFGDGSGMPCTYCPIPKLSLNPGEESSEPIVWEHYNKITEKTYLIKDSIIRWVDGQLVHLEVAVDISHRIEYEEKLRYYASTDSLTGIYNREWGRTELELKLATPGGNGSLCFIDVDGLKRVNDNLGHAYGDELLRETVRIIREALTKAELFCRWGGDEFLVWMGQPPEHANKRMEQIQQTLEDINSQNIHPFKLSFSYGILPFHAQQGENLDTLVTEADKLMYKDKLAKRGQSTARRRSDTP